MEASEIREALRAGAALKERVAADEALVGQIARMAAIVHRALADGHRVYLCGNGGSAADAQHLAAEFVERFGKERRAWPALALTTDTSVLTAVANDRGFQEVFARQVEAFVQPGDVLLAFSTSGNSANVLAAAQAAKRKGAKVLGLAGKSGGKLRKLCDECFVVPSGVTCRIQEVHITVGHVVCDLVERAMTARRAGETGES